MTYQRGKFITLEGIEGVGKSTNLDYIAELLSRNKISFLVTREPGGTPLAEEIREVLLSTRAEPVSEMAELLLMFAARAQHLATKIVPALESGQWVLCDRFTDATFAYQGGGRQMSRAVIEQLQQLVQKELRPDCTIYLDAPVEVGLARASQRGEADRFEAEQAAFFERVRNEYLRLAEAEAGRYRIIDASRDLEAVQEQIRVVLSPLLDSTKGQL